MAKNNGNGKSRTRAGVTRRDVLKALAATGAAAGASPLVSLTGCAATPAATTTTETRSLYFDLSHLRPDEHDFVLFAGKHRIQLSRTDATELSEARKSNAFLGKVASTRITHHVKGLELPAKHVLACHVKVHPRGSRASWKMGLMFWNHPTESVRAAHARMPLKLRNTLTAKARRAGLLGSAADLDPVEEASYIDPSSQATYMASCHPELLSGDATSNAHVSQAYLQRNNPDVEQLSDYIQGNPDDWADNQVITDDNGVPFTDTQGNVIQLPMYSDDTNSLLGPSISTGTKGVKSDAQLGWYSSSGTAAPSGAIWIADDGQTHDDQSVSSATAAMGGAALRRRAKLGSGESVLFFPELGKHKGYQIEAGATETDPATLDHTVEVKFHNSYCRHLGLYVRYLDAACKPIPLATLSDFLKRHSGTFVSNPTTAYDIRFGMMGPEFEFLGIPCANATFEANLPVPSVASSFQVVAEGIGTGTNDFPGLTTGKTLTSVLDLSVPMVFLATAATAEFSAWAKTQGPKMFLEVLECFEDAIAGFVDVCYDGNDAGAWGELVKAIVGKLLTELAKKAGASMAAFVADLCGFIVAGDATDACPLVGGIIEAVTATATVAQLGQTIGEVCSSPRNYDNAGLFLHDIEVTIKPDSDDPAGFPAVATHYVVSAECKRTDASGNVIDSSSPITFQGQMGATQVTDPIPVGLTVPYGGSIEVTVGFYSDTGWLAGQGTTGMQDNTLDSFAITIQENLVPLIATTFYTHKEKTAIDAGGNHSLVGTTTPPRGTPSCIDTPGAVCAITSLTNLNTSPGGVGYAWQSYNDPSKYYQCGSAGGSGQLYGFANVGVTARPQNGYLAASCGLMGPVRVAYALTGSNVMNFYLDDRRYIRQIRLTGNDPAYDAPTSNRAFGRFNYASDAFFVTKAGKVVSVNHGASKIESLVLPSLAVADADAPLATAACGPGTRPGLMDGPLCSGLTADDTLLILEGGANQVQAFDSAGNPVPKFPGLANPYAFPLARYPATDANGVVIRIYTDLAVEYRGYVFLFSYPVSNPSLQSLDIYDPSGNWVCRTLDVPGAKFTVSYWRNLYAGNYETLHNPVNGLYEPSISHWIPSTP